MSIAALVQEMADAGATAQLIAIAVRAVEAAGAKEREYKAKDSARVALYRRRGGGNIPDEMRREIYERDNFTCVYCESQDDLTCDHVVPVSKGGGTTLENLATACRPCNSRKRDRDRKYIQRHQADIQRTSADIPTKGADTVSQVSPPIDNITLTPSSSLSIELDARVTPRSILLECLSPEMAGAVIDHRRAKRSPLTLKAAQLLVKGFLSTGQPQAAAEMMIARGWQGFKPEWFEKDKTDGQDRRSNSVSAAAARLAELGDAFTLGERPSLTRQPVREHHGGLLPSR